MAKIRKHLEREKNRPSVSYLFPFPCLLMPKPSYFVLKRKTEMKRILLALLLCGFGFPGTAQEDSTKVLDLNEVTIMENRMEIPFAEVSRNIHLIQREEIETSPARSIQEVLSFVPGIDVRQRGVGGIQADVGIRGGSFDQTLMLLNGIKLNDPQTGHHMMNIPIPLYGISRIEVLKGPGSRIYGPNAYAGAVNIRTLIPNQRTFNGQIYGGDFGLRGGSISASLPVGNYRQTLAVSHDASDGHWHNSDFKVSNVFYEAALEVDDQNELKAMAAFADRDFGANGFFTNSHPDQWESVQTFLYALSHTLTTQDWYLQSRTYWRRNLDEFRLRRHEPEFFTNNHSSDVLAIEVNARYDSKIGSTGLGLEGRKEKIESNNLGNRQREFVGIFAEHRLSFWDKWDFRAGMYSNYYNEYGWKHFPGAELGFQLSESSRLYSNYGKSYRIPTFTDLYYEDPSNVSNPDLEPEQAVSLEAGWKYQKGKVAWELVYFNRHTENLIDWIRAPGSESPNPWTAENMSEVTFHGLETSFNYAWQRKIGWTTLEKISFSYNLLDANLTQPEGVESRYALNSLKHQLIGGLQAGFGETVELTVKARYLERIASDPYFLLDARVDFRRMKVIGFFLEASNISNTEYTEAGFVQMPRRWVKGGVSFNLE